MFHKVCYKGIYLPISSNEIIFIFKNIPNGNYAISIFHDENNNKKLDKNILVCQGKVMDLVKI